jgi:hypothetical protein
MDHNLPSHLSHPLPRLLQQNNATRLSVSWVQLSEYTDDISNAITLSYHLSTKIGASKPAI